MANEIKEALKNAVDKAEQEENVTEVSARVKKLLARKRNLQRKSHNPKRSRK
jgi:hypothetical protein